MSVEILHMSIKVASTESNYSESKIATNYVELNYLKSNYTGSKKLFHLKFRNQNCLYGSPFFLPGSNFVKPATDQVVARRFASLRFSLHLGHCRYGVRVMKFSHLSIIGNFD